MDNEFDRYYIKIQTILGIDPKKIHEELATALGPNAPSYQTVTSLRRDVKYRQQRARNNRHNYLYQNRTRITRSPMKKASNNMLR
ncbi:unnamed protein product [Rotaria sp. Silwood2]|nr:unnamed protein product [Rotaria sp. Silwood2]